MASWVLVRSTSKRKTCWSCSWPTWNHTLLLSTFLLICGVSVALNTITIDLWSLFAKTWAQRSNRVLTHPNSFKSNATNSQWKLPESFHVLYPHKYRFILDEPEKCRSQSPFLVLMVPVAPQERTARDTIRQTWGNQNLLPGVTISRFFLLGQVDQPGGLQEELEAESSEHHDLLQANFLDSYYNLTIKTMLMMEWLASRCSNAIYAAKVDTDMFLNVELLVKLLLDPHAAQHKQNYITGHITRKGLVKRQKSSKFYVSWKVYPRATYPQYVLGNAYVFSMDLPVKILVASRHVRAFHLEDVYLGMCLEYLKIKPTDPPKLGLFHFKKIPYSRCKYDRLIATSKLEPHEIEMCWNDFQKPGSRC